MPNLLSLRAYAKHRGVSLMAVQKAIKSQRISGTLDDKGNVKIDPETADKDWAENTDHSKNYGANKKRIPPAAEPEYSPTDDDRGDESPGVVIAGQFQKSRAIRETYQARTAKLNYEVKAGKLVEADKIRLEAFQAARLTRDTLLNIPNKIAAELAAETDPGKIYAILTDAISQALEELVAEGIRRMEAREANDD